MFLKSRPATLKSSNLDTYSFADESGTASNIAVDDLGHNVKMIYFVDGRVGLEGTLLKNTAPLLETILHFIPLDSSLGSLSCSQRTSDTPRWVSSWPINLVERSFVHTVIKHRIPALVTNEDQLVAIPEGRRLHMIIYCYALFITHAFARF